MQRSIGTIIAIALIGIFGLAACEPVSAPSGQPTEDVLPIGAPAPEATTTTSTTTSTTVPDTGWKLVGGDEFDGGAVNTAKWKPYYNTYGDGNHELACLTPSNVTQGAGAVTITARKETKTCPSGSVREYTSGFLGSRETGTYYPMFGRFEMRAKVPHAQGLWPAFWLRHRNGASTAEVDIMEYFHSQLPGKVTQTLHLDGVYNVSKRNTSFEAPTVSPGWHTFAAEIAPDPTGVRFTFFLDEATTHTFVDTKHGWLDKAPADATWDIAVNQAVGGRWAGHPDGTLGLLELLNRCSISGVAPAGCTTTGIQRVDWSKPAQTTYEVDWVRAFVRAG